MPQVFARSTIVPGAELMLHDTGPSSVAAGPAKSSPKKSQYLPIEPSQSKSGLKVHVEILVLPDTQHHFLE